MTRKTRTRRIEKKYPVAHETENLVLGACLHNPDLIELFHEEDLRLFTTYEHRTIFLAMLGLKRRAASIDPVTLKDELDARGELTKIGGVTTIARLLDNPPIRDIGHYLAVLKDKACARELIALFDTLTEDLQSGEYSQEALSRLHREIQRLSAENAVLNHIDRLDETMQKALDVIKRRFARTDRRLTFGLIDLDEKLIVERGDLIIIGGRPSIGKTAFALTLMNHLVEKNEPVWFISLEMSREQLCLRLISMQTGIDLFSLRKGDVRIRDIENIRQIIDRIGSTSTRAHIVEMIRTPDEIRTLIEQTHTRDAWIIIDYLQLMKLNRHQSSRENEIGEIVTELKALASEYQLTIVALSQLNREVEKRSGPPRMSDLRESGKIEQAADVIILLHRHQSSSSQEHHPFSDEGDENEHIVQAIIAKHRNGPTGVVDLYFDTNSTRFMNLAKID